MSSGLPAAGLRSDAAVLALERQRPAHLPGDPPRPRAHVPGVQHQRRYHPIAHLITNEWSSNWINLNELQKWNDSSRAASAAVLASHRKRVKKEEDQDQDRDREQQEATVKIELLPVVVVSWLVVRIRTRRPCRCAGPPTPKANRCRHLPNALGDPLTHSPTSPTTTPSNHPLQPPPPRI